MWKSLCVLSAADCWLASWVVGASLAASPHFPSFLVVMLADFLATVSLYIPYTHLPTLAVSRGLDTAQVGFLISAAGISNTCGRVTAGWLGDQDWLHPVTLSLVATSLSSVPLLLMTRYCLPLTFSHCYLLHFLVTFNCPFQLPFPHCPFCFPLPLT